MIRSSTLRSPKVNLFKILVELRILPTKIVSSLPSRDWTVIVCSWIALNDANRAVSTSNSPVARVNDGKRD